GVVRVAEAESNVWYGAAAGQRRVAFSCLPLGLERLQVRAMLEPRRGSLADIDRSGRRQVIFTRASDVAGGTERRRAVGESGAVLGALALEICAQIGKIEQQTIVFGSAERLL